jgi:hypothetical protein
MHLAFHLTIATALYSRFDRTTEKAMVVALRLRREETADTHGYCTGNELGYTAEDDELRLAE